VPPHSHALVGSSDGSLIVSSPNGKTVTRIDAATGQVLSTQDLGRGGALSAVEIDRSVWIVQQARPDAPRLLQLDARTLAIRRVREYDSVAEGIAAADGHVWLGTGHILTEIDPVSGRTIDRFPLLGGINLVAGDADSSLVFVTLEGPVRKDRSPLLEIDGSTGDVLASARAGYADLGGVSHLVPAPNGVWVGEPTGMMGTLGFYATDGLMGLVPPRGFDEGKDGHGVIHGANSITGAYAAGYLWVAYGEGTVTCADARTGRKLGTLTDGSISGSADIVTVSGRPMTVIDSTLFVIDEQLACS